MVGSANYPSFYFNIPPLPERFLASEKELRKMHDVLTKEDKQKEFFFIGKIRKIGDFTLIQEYVYTLVQEYLHQPYCYKHFHRIIVVSVKKDLQSAFDGVAVKALNLDLNSKSYLKLEEKIQKVKDILIKYEGNNLFVIAEVKEKDKDSLIVMADIFKEAGWKFLITTQTFEENNNLPRRLYSKLIGREQDIDQINRRLHSFHPVINIEGSPGIGKTTIAIEIGYRCLPSFIKKKSRLKSFDYVVWISAQNKPEQKQWLNEVINEVAKVIGQFNIVDTSGEKLEEKKIELQSLLSSKGVLIIIDNFDSIEDIELENWLYQIPPPSKVLITSNKDQNHINAWNVPLNSLDNKDALALVKTKIRSLGLKGLYKGVNNSLQNLVKFIGGNPKAIELALGHIKSGTISLDELIRELEKDKVSKNINTIFEFLHNKAWEKLTIDAKKVLMIMPICVGRTSINEEAVFSISKLSEKDFHEACKQLLDRNLIDSNVEKGTLLIHPVTRDFARGKISADKNFEENARREWINFYLKFIKNKVVRRKPNELYREVYWNTLVSDGMEGIDFDWRSIRELLGWSVSHNKYLLLLELVLLLVHYMDSRFYNQERIFFVRKAINACQNLKRKEYYEALLYVDALGWTYVEEGNLTEANDSIVKGYKICRKKLPPGAKADGVAALACAWLARVRIEQERPKAAFKLINIAVKYNGKAWIKSRIYQAAGDIYYKQEKYEEALIYYQNAKKECDEYNGEGHDYRINPRIGLAFLSYGNLEKAEEMFKSVKDNHHIKINELYGQYGLALVVFEREKRDKSNANSENYLQASQKLKAIEKEVYKRSKSNILLKLINQYKRNNGIE